MLSVKIKPFPLVSEGDSSGPSMLNYPHRSLLKQGERGVSKIGIVKGKTQQNAISPARTSLYFSSQPATFRCFAGGNLANRAGVDTVACNGGGGEVELTKSTVLTCEISCKKKKSCAYVWRRNDRMSRSPSPSKLFTESETFAF